MTDLSNQRRMAATILQCGENRVWMDPASGEDLADAVTRHDIRGAIKAGVIRRREIQGTSRVRARQKQIERKKGHHQGPGSRKGSPLSRLPRKDRWMLRVRAQRRLLRELREAQKITSAHYRKFYRQSKGGMFRSRAHLLLNLRLVGALPPEGSP